MPRRQGASLIEVLIAIFVMGIGMIALLTLFPLGALRMAQAIQDHYCTTAVTNANAVATLWDIRNDPIVNTPPWFPKVNVFQDTPPGEARKPADPNGPSYPVFIDPVGVRNSLPGPAQYWLCGNGSSKGLIARVPTSFAQNASSIYKWFWLMDDFIFETDETKGGVPFNFNPIPPPPPQTAGYSSRHPLFLGLPGAKTSFRRCVDRFVLGSRLQK